MNVKDHRIGWQKVLDNQAITSVEFVNCNNHVITTLLLSIEDIRTERREESDEDEEKAQVVPNLGSSCWFQDRGTSSSKFGEQLLVSRQRNGTHVHLRNR
jgi:hypothetical protein